MTTKAFEEKTIKLNEATIQCRKDGIIHVVFNEGTEVNVELQYKLLNLYIELCEGDKRLFMFSAHSGVSITKEARDNSEKIESVYPAIATAVVADSVAYTLVANFYLKINKPKSPYKVFREIASAEAWLKTFN